MIDADQEPVIVEVCKHNAFVGLCKECQVEAMQAKKQAKKRTPIKALKNRSRDQENKVADGYKSVGFRHAKRQAMSGALQVLPGDVDPGELLLVECKETRTGRMVIDPEWLAQVMRQSQNMGRSGWYALHSWVADGSKNYHKVVVVDEDLWYSVLGKFKEENAQA